MSESSARTPYKHAFETALTTLHQQDPHFAAAQTGTAFFQDEGRFLLESMGEKVHVTFETGDVTWARDGKELPLDWRLITINYLSRGDGRPLTGKLISYRELDGGHVFYPNLREKVIDRLAANLGHRNKEDILSHFRRFKGTPVEGCDVGAVFYLFPRFPVTVKLWLPDEEFPASANILFDSSAGGYLHTEDIAAAASIVGGLAGDKASFA